MDSLWSYLVSLVLSGVGMLVLSRILPGMHIRGGLGSAILVSFVYGLLKTLFQKVLILMTLPVVALSLGAFVLVINAMLLWLTDKLLKRFEVDGVLSLLIGAGALSVVDILVRWLMKTQGF